MPRRQFGPAVQAQSCAPSARDQAGRRSRRLSKARTRRSPLSAPAARVQKTQMSECVQAGRWRVSAGVLTWPTCSQSRVARMVNHKSMVGSLRMAEIARIWAYDAPEHVFVRSEVRNKSCGLRARCAGGGAPNACVAGRCGRCRGRGSSDVAGRAHRAKARPARGAAREQSRGLCALPWPIDRGDLWLFD